MTASKPQALFTHVRLRLPSALISLTSAESPSWRNLRPHNKLISKHMATLSSLRLLLSPLGAIVVGDSLTFPSLALWACYVWYASIMITCESPSLPPPRWTELRMWQVLGLFIWGNLCWLVWMLRSCGRFSLESEWGDEMILPVFILGNDYCIGGSYSFLFCSGEREIRFHRVDT